MNSYKVFDELSPEFEKQLGYVFKNKSLLLTALTHSSFSNEKDGKRHKCNETLEFLGDSVMNACVSEIIYKEMPLLNEGDMTKIRAAAVCEESLVQCSRNLRIGEIILLGLGEEKSGGRQRPSILADAFEAVLGALYLDSDFRVLKEIVEKFLREKILLASKGRTGLDYKTILQETYQSKGDVKIEYKITDEFGPPHNRSFVAEVYISGVPTGKGEGRTKKDAEKVAAKNALISTGELDE